MTDDEDGHPTMFVRADGVQIRVEDTRTAELALQVIEPILEYHLASPASTTSGIRKARHEPVDATCKKCGYEWVYRGADPMGATCPGCRKYTRFDPPLDERGLR